MTRKADPTTQAAAMLQMALRAILLSGQVQCLDPGKQTEELDSPGATDRRTPRKSDIGESPYSVRPPGPGVIHTAGERKRRER